MPNARRSVAPAAWRREGLGQAPAALDPAIAVGTAARPQSRGHRLPVGQQAAAVPLGLEQSRVVEELGELLCI